MGTERSIPSTIAVVMLAVTASCGLPSSVAASPLTSIITARPTGSTGNTSSNARLPPQHERLALFPA
jgi:hypothetical protein